MLEIYWCMFGKVFGICLGYKRGRIYGEFGRYIIKFALGISLHILDISLQLPESPRIYLYILPIYFSNISSTISEYIFTLSLHTADILPELYLPNLPIYFPTILSELYLRQYFEYIFTYFPHFTPCQTWMDILRNYMYVSCDMLD
jgi:hypothetical protein